METQKPKSIKTVSLIITIIAGLMMFSNLAGALMFTLMGFGYPSYYQGNSEVTFIDAFTRIISQS